MISGLVSGIAARVGGTLGGYFYLYFWQLPPQMISWMVPLSLLAVFIAAAIAR